MDDRSTTDRLLAAIRTTAGQPSLEWEAEPKPLTGGFWAEMWRVRLDDNSEEGLCGDLVARIMPDPATAERETRLQDHLSRLGFATPRVRLSSPPGPDLTRAWILMDFCPGEPLLNGLTLGQGLIQMARDLPDRMARLAADLHRVDAADLPARFSVGPFLDRLREQAVEAGRPDLAAAGRWLGDHRPTGAGRSITHGDLHPFNVLVGPDGDTLVDWSTARVADPAYDVAFTRLVLKHPPLGAPAVTKPLVWAAGLYLSRRFARTYDLLADAPIDPHQLEWFTGIHALRILVEVAGWRAAGTMGGRVSHPFTELEGPWPAGWRP